MILITGATGLTGTEVVRRLSARGVPVRALVRNPERAAGVAHVVKLSGIMPERDSAFRFARMHGDAEAYLEASGMAFTHLRAGEFMPAYFRQAAGIAATGSFMLPMADARIASIDVGDLAEVAVLTLTAGGHEGKIYRLTGPEALTMTDVADRLAAATAKTVRYIDVRPEVHLEANLGRGMPPYLAEALVELYAERRNGKEGTVFADTAELLGRRPVSFGEFAQRNAAIFRGVQAVARV